ncbi:MAG: nucleotidyltransferase family protein [Planctomycetaceae bacterium]
MSVTTPRLFAVIPAAGLSRRMGRPKLLLPWGERTVIAQVLSVLARPEISRRLVVIRAADTVLRAAVLHGGGEVLIPTTDPPEMRDSVEFALKFIGERCAPQDHDGWLLAPADHPLLDAAPLAELLARWSRGDCRILVPTWHGRRGHPVLFRWELAAQVASLPKDCGINALVREQPSEVVELQVGSPAVISDLDTPEDYERLLRDRQGKPAKP